jgi:hypothetical protein
MSRKLPISARDMPIASRSSERHQKYFFYLPLQPIKPSWATFSLVSSMTTLSSIPLRTLYSQLRPFTVRPGSPKAKFTNWGQTFTCAPLAVFEPESEYHCELILELARREGKTVRAVGVGHSPSDLACTSEYMLRTHKLNRILEVNKGYFADESIFNSAFLILLLAVLSVLCIRETLSLQARLPILTSLSSRLTPKRNMLPFKPVSLSATFMSS